MSGGVGVRAFAATAPTIPFERYRLDNGLEVILHRDNTAASMYVALWYRVGGLDDPPGKSGLAHLSEHMMFEGSQHVAPSEHFAATASAHTNAFTSTNCTVYHQRIEKRRLETTLWLESDRMAFLKPALSEERFVNQRDVVLNERRQTYENSPNGAEALAWQTHFYPQGHPLQRGVIGLAEEIQALSLDDVRQFLSRWYVPSNATLLVAGDLEPGAVKALVAKWFGSLPRVPRPTHVAPPRVSFTKATQHAVKDPFGESGRVRISWPTTARVNSADDVALAAAGALLSRSPLGRLQGRLTFASPPKARNVIAYHSPSIRDGIFEVVVDLAPEVEPSHVQFVILDAIGELRTNTVSERELEQVKAEAEVSVLEGIEDLEGRGNALLAFNDVVDDPGGLDRRLRTFRELRPGTVMAAVRRHLTDLHLTISSTPGRRP